MKLICLLLFFVISVSCNSRSNRVMTLPQLQNRCLTHQNTAQSRDKGCTTQNGVKMQMTSINGGVFFCIGYRKRPGDVYNAFDVIKINLHPDYDIQYTGANVIDYEQPCFKVYQGPEYNAKFAIFSNNSQFRIYFVTINDVPQSCNYGRKGNRVWPHGNKTEEIPDNPPSEANDPIEPNQFQPLSTEKTITSTEATTTTTTTIPEIKVDEDFDSDEDDEKERNPEEEKIDDEKPTDVNESPNKKGSPYDSDDDEDDEDFQGNDQEQDELTTTPTTTTTTSTASTTSKKPNRKSPSNKNSPSDRNSKKKQTTTTPPSNITEPSTIPDKSDNTGDNETTSTLKPEASKSTEKTPRDEQTTTTSSSPKSSKKTTLNRREPTTTIATITTSTMQTPVKPEKISATTPSSNNDNNENKDPTCGMVQKIIDLSHLSMPSNPGQYPFAASIYQHVDGENNSIFKCSGSIVDQSVIITSVNCLMDENGRLMSEDEIQVHVGQYSKNAKSPQSKVFEVEQIMPHEQFNFKLDNNLAALKLKRKLEFDEFIQPICIPDKNISLMNGNVMGKNPGYDESGIMNEVDYLMSYDDEVEDIYETPKTFNGNNTSNNINSTSLGGGLFMKNPVAADQWIIVGIVSKLPHPSSRSCNAVFTNVIYFVDWIHGCLATLLRSP